MKNYVLIGRDTIEKNVGNASLIPTYSDFKSLHGAYEAILGIGILVVFSLKSAFLTFLEKQVHVPKPAYKL